MIFVRKGKVNRQELSSFYFLGKADKTVAKTGGKGPAQMWRHDFALHMLLDVAHCLPNKYDSGFDLLQMSSFENVVLLL